MSTTRRGRMQRRIEGKIVRRARRVVLGCCFEMQEGLKRHVTGRLVAPPPVGGVRGGCRGQDLMVVVQFEIRVTCYVYVVQMWWCCRDAIAAECRVMHDI